MSVYIQSRVSLLSHEPLIFVTSVHTFYYSHYRLLNIFVIHKNHENFRPWKFGAIQYVMRYKISCSKSVGEGTDG